jgi:D-alanyl-D-alanine endopeptidase (penicillin-binding protein 7)
MLLSISLDASLSWGATASSRKARSVPDVRSSAVLVVDRSDSSTVYARRADQVAPIASITKLMTALVVLDGKQPLDELIEITKEDRSRSQGSPSRLAISAKLTRGDLMRLALMSSENRAAHALGRSYPGGERAIVRAMNAKAKALGMTQSRARGISSSSSSPRAVARPSASTRQRANTKCGSGARSSSIGTPIRS